MGETFERNAIAGELLDLIDPLGLPVSFTRVNYSATRTRTGSRITRVASTRGARAPGERRRGSPAASSTRCRRASSTTSTATEPRTPPPALPWPSSSTANRAAQPASPWPSTTTSPGPRPRPRSRSRPTPFGSRAGLPDVNSWSSAAFVFDQSDPLGTNALSGLARLFDPLSDRTVQVRAPGSTDYITGPGYEVFFAPDDYDPMDGLATVKTPDGKFQLARLPFSIRIRLLWDEDATWSGAAGSTSPRTTADGRTPCS